MWFVCLLVKYPKIHISLDFADINYNKYSPVRNYAVGINQISAIIRESNKPLPDSVQRHFAYFCNPKAFPIHVAAIYLVPAAVTAAADNRRRVQSSRQCHR